MRKYEHRSIEHMDMVWTSIGLPTYPSSAIGIAAFLIATIVGGSILTGIVTSALGIGSYWPPGERNWNYYVHWIGSQVFNLAIIVAYVAAPGEWIAPLHPIHAMMYQTYCGFREYRYHPVVRKSPSSPSVIK